MKTYKIKVINGILGANFTIYFSSHPNPIAGGSVSEKEFDVIIPSECEGPGKMKVFYKQRSRTFQTIAYSVPFEAYPGKNNEISFTRENREVSPAPKKDKEEASKPDTSQEDSKSAVETIQDLTDNDLRDEVQKKKTGNSFWDNLK